MRNVGDKLMRNRKQQGSRYMTERQDGRVVLCQVERQPSAGGGLSAAQAPCARSWGAMSTLKCYGGAHLSSPHSGGLRQEDHKFSPTWAT